MNERLSEVRAAVHRGQGGRHEAAAVLTRAQAAAAAAHRHVRALDAGSAALHAVRDITSARIQQTVAELCTDGLRVVFDDPEVRLEVRTVERRSVVEANLVLVRGDLETDPLESNGGGLVADAVAMLRLVMVRLLATRGLAPLLVLDEPLAAVSAGRRAAMAQMLEDVAAALGIQVIVVTHDETLMRGLVYRVQMVDRATQRSIVARDD